MLLWVGELAGVAVQYDERSRLYRLGDQVLNGKPPSVFQNARVLGVCVSMSRPAVDQPHQKHQLPLQLEIGALLER